MLCRMQVSKAAAAAAAAVVVRLVSLSSHHSATCASMRRCCAVAGGAAAAVATAQPPTWLLCTSRRHVSTGTTRPPYTGRKRPPMPFTRDGDGSGDEDSTQMPLYAKKIESERDIPSAEAMTAALPSLWQLREELPSATELQRAIDENRIGELTAPGYQDDEDDDGGGGGGDGDGE